MGKERGVIAWMANNPVAANLLMITIMIGGLAAISGITKEVFPTFPSEQILVTVPYPGSSPEEVEAGIIRTLEEELLNVVDVDEISSVAREGMGEVTVQMLPGTPMSRALVQIKTRVDGISTFPGDAEEPNVEEQLFRTRAMNITIYGDLSESQLKEIADELRDEVLAIPGISQVSIDGVRDYEIAIEVSDNDLQRYGLTFDDVVQAIQLRSRDLPGGKIRTGNGSVTIRSVGQAYTAEDFELLNLITRSDGTVLRLNDVATVRDGFVDQPTLSRHNGRRSVTLVIDRVGNEDVLAMTDNVRKFVEAKRDAMPPGVALSAWADRSVILKGRINLMLKSAVQGAVLVMITLALFLNTSLAFWVILGVPFSFLGALLVMNLPFVGMSINIFSVFGFILVLGMLVDDGIVTAESAFAQLEDERDGVDSIVRGVKRVAVATVFGALTTMVAFSPAGILTEGVGRLISVIVPVVILSLMFSLLETKLILPAHLRHLKIGQAQPPKNPIARRFAAVQSACSNGMRNFSERSYRPLLLAAIEYRYICLALFIGVWLICVSLVPGGIVRFVFFPNVPSDNIAVNLRMPNGTPWQKTHDYAIEIESAAYSLNERYRQETGVDRDVVQELLTVSNEDTRARINVDLIDSTQRDITSVQLAGWMREALGELPGVQSLDFDANAGPSGSPIDVELGGDNLDDLRAAANELKLALLDFAGVSDVRDTFNGGGPELDIQIRPEGEALGLGQVELARQVRQAFFGAEVQRLQRGRHEVRVYVRLPEHQRDSLEALRSLWINIPEQGRVPFDVVGSAVERIGVSEINRFNRQRVVNVLADVDKSVVEPDQVNRVIVDELLPDILAAYPGVTHRLAGEAEAQAESTRSLELGFITILLVIYAALAVPLRSYAQPLIIMAVIPFGLIGAVLGHLILGNDISMLSMIGMIGLTGIVVNDSLVLVDHVNQRMKQAAESFQEAVVNGAVRRFRPVVLTSITTFVGLAPIQLETAIQAQFVKPMAISVAFGVLFATVVTLVLVPTLYFIGRDIGRLAQRDPQPTGQSA
ncbi:MAG: efflux RND transporter permease subunit [Pseudomonadota bacterium]